MSRGVFPPHATCNRYGTTPLQPPQLFCDSIGFPTIENTGTFNTAVGCIRLVDVNSPINLATTLGMLLSFTLPWSIGVAGGIAFILVVIAGFIITTSSGDPYKMSSGKELLTAAISGILLLIFAVFILRLIGKQILQIPGL
jgi:hypothetical protein